MLIIKIAKESNGTHESQVSSEDISPPDGWIVVPIELEPETTLLLPFVNMTIVDGAVTSVEDDADARAIWTSSSERAQADNLKSEQITSLKVQLSSTDYKIIKCYEYALAQLPAPYDVDALHAERQEIRDQITALGG